MKPIKPTQLSNLRKGCQFTMPGDPNTVWEVTEESKQPGAPCEVMNLTSRRVYDDLPTEQDVFAIPYERRLRLSDIQVGDRVLFTDMHYGITGNGVVENITYPNGQPVYHLHQLKGCPPGFTKTYISPSEYVGDTINRVSTLKDMK